MTRNGDRWVPPPIPQGMVTLENIGGGWYQVAIGRARGTKRFNLSDAEGRQLVALLATHGITADTAQSPAQPPVKAVQSG